MSMVSESLLSTSMYNKPMVLKDKDAVAILLLRLLIMTPGTNRQHPEMGVDVRGRYQYASEDEVDELSDEIRLQIDTYLPNFNTSTVDCTVSDKVLKISINVDGTVFKFSSGNNLSDDEISLNSDI